ncbi:amidohydrolase [Saxibacter everestensis]|uniref:Amidohydrolase n=1 Tax=Saxibacter everestensis TaxID=2909229 RepID=A0ABY8QSW2_9MICO|nr:amidohydrolase [Brevibacteriaceae bacterium ZFBP1038]
MKNSEADIVITNATVWTGDAAGSWTHAVAIRGDSVVALGTEAEALAGSGAQVIDADGGMVTPGFQDAHIHPAFAARDMQQLWLNDTEPSKEAYLEQIRQYAADNPEADWITGGGWAMEAFPGGTPHKADLDAIVPDRPVFIMNRDVHGAWANSKALEIAGIDNDTPDPSDGRYERDPETGELTGCLHEGAAYTFKETIVPLAGIEDWKAAILTAQKHLHALGITGWQDAWVSPDTLEAYRQLGESGLLTARVVGALWWERKQGLEQIERFVRQRDEGAAPNFLPQRVKIMADGVLENYTGALLEPYCDGCGGQQREGGRGSGLSYVEPEVLQQAVTELDRLGFGVHMHAIGDRAVRNCLDAVEAARRANGFSDNVHHIAHVQIVNPDDLPRFRELGVVANLQALWACAEPQMTELTLPILGEQRSEQQFPFGDLHRSGAMLAMGSDWAVSTANPLPQIEVAVTRVDPDERDAEPFLPEQKLDLATALRAFTGGSAHVNGDSRGGWLGVGQRADLAILDRNIFAIQPRIADAKVTMTIAGGRIVFDANADDNAADSAPMPGRVPDSASKGHDDVVAISH